MKRNRAPSPPAAHCAAVHFAAALAVLSLGCPRVVVDAPPEGAPPEDTPPKPPWEDDTPACDASLPKGWEAIPSSASVGFEIESYWNYHGVWTGDELLVINRGKGAAYAPSTGSWRRIADMPEEVSVHGAIWSGAALYVIDFFRPVLSYDPVSDTWTSIPEPPLALRHTTAFAWSTTSGELLFWGGESWPSDEDDDYKFFGDGAAYNPATGAWRLLAGSPLSPRGSNTAVWNGSRMIVYGGLESGGVTADAAAYDPVGDAWTMLAPPAMSPRIRAVGLEAGASGELALFWGGFSEACDHCAPIRYQDGGLYDAASGAWALIPDLTTSPFGSPILSGSALWWGAGRLWFWGGNDAESTVHFNDGVAYDPAEGAWSTMPAGSPLGGRIDALAVWTGCEAILYGGRKSGSNDHASDGAVFRP